MRDWSSRIPSTGGRNGQRSGRWSSTVESVTSSTWDVEVIVHQSLMDKDKETLERVQRRAVGMVSNLRGKNYEASLGEVGMTTDLTSLADRRMRGGHDHHLQDDDRQGQN